MKIAFVFLMFMLLISGSIFAQPPDTLWTRTYGGNDLEYCGSVQQTTDGGYIVAGSTASFGAGAHNVYLVKTNSTGDTLWTRTYGGGSADFGHDVQQTTDGGYIVAGNTFSFGAGDSNFYLIKTNPHGNTLWTRTYGGSGIEEGKSVHQTTDEGYIIGGRTNSYGAGSHDFYLVKTDATGDTLWTRTYGGIGAEYGYGVQQTTDGGYIFAGLTNSYGAGANDVYLVKTDVTGDTLWTRTYGGNVADYAKSVQQTSDGGYIVAGSTASFGAGGYDFYLVKTDPTGDTLWTRTHGGSGNDFGYSVHQTTDGGYIVTGESNSYGAGEYDIYLVRTNSHGDTLWTCTHGGRRSDYSYSVQQTADEGYIVAGETISYGAGAIDIWLLKFAPHNYTGVGVENILPLITEITGNYPNPFNPETNIAFSVSTPGHVILEVINIIGEKVKTLINEVRPAGEYSIIWNGRDSNDIRVSSGIYFYKLRDGDFQEVKKMILLR